MKHYIIVFLLSGIIIYFLVKYSDNTPVNVFDLKLSNATKSFIYERKIDKDGKIHIDTFFKYGKVIFPCRPTCNPWDDMDTTIYHKVLGEWKLKEVTKFGPRTTQEVDKDSTNLIFFTKYILDTTIRK